MSIKPWLTQSLYCKAYCHQKKWGGGMEMWPSGDANILYKLVVKKLSLHCEAVDNKWLVAVSHFPICKVLNSTSTNTYSTCIEQRLWHMLNKGWEICRCEDVFLSVTLLDIQHNCSVLHSFQSSWWRLMSFHCLQTPFSKPHIRPYGQHHILSGDLPLSYQLTMASILHTGYWWH